MLGLPLHEWVALGMLVALTLYTLLGGADFGGGVWDLQASGPRAPAQRALIARVIAPVWEANHVWLILLVVLLFVGFPRGYAPAATALHIPLTLMLVGIVARGSAFVFRQYGAPGETQARWGRVFAVASVVTPVFLGISLGTIVGGEVRVTRGLVVSGFWSWLGWFPLAVGLLVLCLFSFLAAVYLCCEASDPALQGDFRRRALASGVLLGAIAWGIKASAGPGTAYLSARLFGASWGWPLQLGTGAVAVLALAALLTRRFRLARVLAIAQVMLMVGGLGLAQRPFLIVPDVTLADAAAPAATLRLLLLALALGSLILAPSLYYLMRVFKRP